MLNPVNLNIDEKLRDHAFALEYVAALKEIHKASVEDAVAAEREACAQVVLGTQFLSNPMSYDLEAIAERIRARSTTSR